MCKRGDTFSLLVLISRVLDHNFGRLNCLPQQSYYAMSRKPIFIVRFYISFLVTLAEGVHPFPSRTRKLSPPAAMVLHTRVWESSTLPRLILEAVSFRIWLLFYLHDTAFIKQVNNYKTLESWHPDRFIKIYPENMIYNYIFSSSTSLRFQISNFSLFSFCLL